MKYNFFQKFLSVFLSSVFVFYTALFSFSAGMQEVQADSVLENLLFPLEKIVEDVSDGNGTTLGIGNSEDNEFLNDNFVKDAVGQDEEEDDDGGNRNFIAGIAGGAGAYAVNAFAPEFVAGMNNWVADSLGQNLAVTTANPGFTTSFSTTNVDISSFAAGDSVSSSIAGQGEFGSIATKDITGSGVDFTSGQGLAEGAGAMDSAFSNIDVGGAAIGGAIAGLVTLLMGGDIKAAIMSAAQSFVTSIASQAIANALFGPGAMIFGAIPWAIPIGIVLSLLMMMFCPVVFIELPDGRVTLPSTFLVGKINKQMKGDSFEKIGLTAEELEQFNKQKSFGNRDQIPFYMNTRTGLVRHYPLQVDEKKYAPLGLVIGEVLPEILYLDYLSLLDLQFDAQEEGEWFLDQNGDPQFFEKEGLISWKKKSAVLEPLSFGMALGEIEEVYESINGGEGENRHTGEVRYPGEGMSGEEKELLSDWIPVSSIGVTEQEDSTPPRNDIHVSFSKKNHDTLKFTVENFGNKDIKLLFDGGIEEVYHAEKLNVLAKFRPILNWFYFVTDNTFIGKIVEREIFAKEGFTLEQKTENGWETIHQWVTYADQRRAITMSNEQLAMSNDDKLIFRITFDSDYLKLNDVFVTISENPEYTLSELEALNLLPELEAVDGNDKQIDTGEFYKFTYQVPYIDTTTSKRELFMQTNGYYHPLTDVELIKERREIVEKLSNFWGNFRD